MEKGQIMMTELHYFNSRYPNLQLNTPFRMTVRAFVISVPYLEFS